MKLPQIVVENIFSKFFSQPFTNFNSLSKMISYVNSGQSIFMRHLREVFNMTLHWWYLIWANDIHINNITSEIGFKNGCSSPSAIGVSWREFWCWGGVLKVGVQEASPIVASIPSDSPALIAEDVTILKGVAPKDHIHIDFKVSSIL